MRIAVLSGKGGTGKTTVSTNLAHAMGLNYVDCDVEEPNGHIFLKPDIEEVTEVNVPIPHVDLDKCTMCNACVKSCQFNALAKTMTEIMLFKELCHGCGACVLACPQNAIRESNRSIGSMSRGTVKGQKFRSGKLNIKEPMAGPIISALTKDIGVDEKVLIDCAPGTSCNVVKALENVDYAVLVTEPTMFGLHDLKLAVSLVKTLKIPFGVLINRSGENASLIKSYCEAFSIDIIGEIPFSKLAAQIYSRGELLSEHIMFKEHFHELGKQVIQAAGQVENDSKDLGEDYADHRY
ncbi:ATP-binding protein [Fusibacter sp. JL216-2]|uniref:ATP-binding protein n=1 Tax=Fusibacter sp. JL216-2 TaxID=3071453 RepID=UPI003D358B2C